MNSPQTTRDGGAAGNSRSLDARPAPEQQGILILSWFTGLHEDYHMPSDSSDKIDYRKMEKITRTLFVTAWSLADAAKRPRIDRPLPHGLGRK